MKSAREATPYIVFWILLGYVAVSSGHYRFTHVHQTDTELLLHFGDALMWRK